MGVGGGGQIELRGGFCFQRFPAALTFLVAASLAVGGRLLVGDPVAQLMPCGVSVLALVAVAAAGRGERSIATVIE